jgi:hypothetical protein
VTLPSGASTIVLVVNDGFADSAPDAVSVTIACAFSGFYAPVANMPASNEVAAGSAIPVRFGLGGDMGTNILAAAYPQSVQVACAGGPYPGTGAQTMTAGRSALSYDAMNDQYVYVWKTEKAWAGTCREWILRLSDGSEHRATFTFKR